MALNIDSTTLAADASEEARQLRVYVQKAAQTALDAAESGNKDEQDPSGSLIYLGNPQTAVPDRLLTCADLDNDQKILWCLMRMQVQHPSKPAATPRRSDLADMLKVSRVTLITKIVGLRIYRWLTRCATIKSTNSTLNHGVVEAIHDQPLPLSDTLYLDPDYITWLESLAQNHSDNYKQIRATARKMLNNIDTEISKPAQDGQADRFYGFYSEDPDTPGVQKLNPDKNTNLPGSIIEPGEISPNTPGSKIEPGKNHQNHPGSKIEPGKITRVQKLNPDKITQKSSNQPTIGIYINKLLRSSSCSSNKYIKTTTTTNTGVENSKQNHAISDSNSKIARCNFSSDAEATVEFSQPTPSKLRFPKCLTQQEQALSLRVLRGIAEADQQYLLDYLRDRVADQTATPVENRLGYLNYLAREFRADRLEPSSYGIKHHRPVVATPSETSAEDDFAAWERQMRDKMGDDAEAYIARAREAAGLEK